MSILIKGIDLPEAYTSAWLTVFECVGEHTFMKTHKVSAEQIQAIPPHGRLVDCETLKDDIAVLLERNEKLIDDWLAYTLDDVIDGTPAIIEAEKE